MFKHICFTPTSDLRSSISATALSSPTKTNNIFINMSENSTTIPCGDTISINTKSNNIRVSQETIDELSDYGNGSYIYPAEWEESRQNYNAEHPEAPKTRKEFAKMLRQPSQRDYEMYKKCENTPNLTYEQYLKLNAQDTYNLGLVATFETDDYTETIEKSSPHNRLIQRHVVCHKNGKDYLAATTQKSEVQGFNNYIEYDENGNETNYIKYTNENGALTQRMHFTSPTGKTFDKVVQNTPTFQSSKVTITDKDGKVSMVRERSYEKTSDSTAKTVVDSKEYFISGLDTDVITIKHNGKTTVINLSELVSKEKMNDSPDGFASANDNERNNIKEKIKKLPGDILVKLSQEVSSVMYLDRNMDDGGFNPGKAEDNICLTALSDIPTFIHELGHAIDDQGKGKGNLSSSDNYQNTYNADSSIARQYALGRETETSTYLLNPLDGEEDRGRKEMFAEIYSMLNSTSVEQIQPRDIVLMKYFQDTVSVINEFTK